MALLDAYGGRKVLAEWASGARDRRPSSIEHERGVLEIATVRSPEWVLFELRERRRQSRACALTGRERQLLDRVAGGDSNQAAAAALGISRNTVQNHLQSIYRKLGVGTRTAAVAALRDLPGPRT
jgi:DNA-binding CsgD family transcriptional regulator